MQILEGKKIGRVTDFNANIWRMQAQGDIRGLIDVLKQGDLDQRRRAAMALRMLGAASAIPVLQDVILAETDVSVREVLVATLAAILDHHSGGSDKAAAASRGMTTAQLIARLNSPNIEHAVRSAQELAEQQEKLAVEALMVTFNNRKLAARVRLAAAEALIKLESAPMEVTLLAALRSPKWNIRRSAAAMLGQLEADWAVEPLIAALRDAHERVRAKARAALEHIDTSEARRAIEAVPAEKLPGTGELPPAESQPAKVDAPTKEPVATSLVTPTTALQPGATLPAAKQPVVEITPAAPTTVIAPYTTLQPSSIAAVNTEVGEKPPSSPTVTPEPRPAEEDTRPMPPVAMSDEL